MNSSEEVDEFCRALRLACDRAGLGQRVRAWVHGHRVRVRIDYGEFLFEAIGPDREVLRAAKERIAERARGILADAEPGARRRVEAALRGRAER